MSASTRSKGRRGEDAAARFLTSRGYRILARNVHLPGGELDLVCLDGNCLVFVEVKLRCGSSFGSALAGVGPRKRAALRAAAADYAQIVAPGRRFRFDVVAIDGNRLALHRNAF